MHYTYCSFTPISIVIYFIIAGVTIGNLLAGKEKRETGCEEVK